MTTTELLFGVSCFFASYFQNYHITQYNEVFLKVECINQDVLWMAPVFSYFLVFVVVLQVVLSALFFFQTLSV